MSVVFHKSCLKNLISHWHIMIHPLQSFHVNKSTGVMSSVVHSIVTMFHSQSDVFSHSAVQQYLDSRVHSRNLIYCLSVACHRAIKLECLPSLVSKNSIPGEISLSMNFITNFTIVQHHSTWTGPLKRQFSYTASAHSLSVVAQVELFFFCFKFIMSIKCSDR